MVYDCQHCGACCRGLDVLLDEADTARFLLGPQLLALTHLHQVRPGWKLRFMRRSADTDTCVALEGPLTNCRCTIYEQRPDLCRQFEAGSPDCLAARARVYGDDPPPTV